MSSNSQSPSISDIVNAKIIELLLECCRKTVIECSNHYGFSSEEALGKMGLLTDYSSLFQQKMQMQIPSEEGSVSDVSVSVKTPVLEKKVSKPRAKKVEGEVKEKKPRAKKVLNAVAKEETPKLDMPKEEVPNEVASKEVSEVVTDVVKEVAKVETPKVETPKKEKKPRAKKEKVEGEVKEKKVASPKVASPKVASPKVASPKVEGEVKEKKPRAKKEKKEGDEESKSKGRPKKEKKETESVSPIDDLFANLVAKEEESPQVDVVNKMEFQGTTYLKSKNTGIIYNMDQDVVGKWNENTKTIDFDEEEEEEDDDE